MATPSMVAAQRMNRKLSEERDSQRASVLANEAVQLSNAGDKVVCVTLQSGLDNRPLTVFLASVEEIKRGCCIGPGQR
jgi:hypothetical protein